MWYRIVESFSGIVHSTDRRSMLANVNWLLADRLFRILVGLFVSVWMARYLGTEDFGRLNLALAIVSFFTVFASLGLDQILLRDLIKANSDSDRLLGTACFLKLLAGSCAYLLLTVILLLTDLQDPMVAPLTLILGGSLLFKFSDVVLIWFESRVEAKHTVLVQSAVLLASSLVKVGLILYGAPLIAFAWVLFAEAAITATALLLRYQTRGFRLLDWRFTLSAGKSLLKDAWPIVISSISIAIYMRVDQVMLGQMVGSASVGIYSAAIRLSESWFFIPVALVNSIFPKVLKLRERNTDEYLLRTQQLYTITTAVCVPVAAVLSLLSVPLIHFLFGESYHEAGPILALLAWTGIFVGMGVARSKWLIAENLQKIGVYYILIAMASNILLNFFLIPRYGPTGAAIATLCAQITTALIAPLFFSKTRISALMLGKSLSPLRWLALIKELRD
ncbi:MAG: oligosaccharide flippase family protein [Verrucomicrobia bacterium]|jgi:PST family polysaccharide transporter|nr:oligosaccharide flippase family protein [Verrucomicrobiota bacterium]